jgi:pSer/pThr/pTyr-binding forkhead associated (FHA) protein
MASRLRSDSHRFCLCPVVKRGVNPWADRVLVGRAANNDIVLRDESISKVHAYFERGPGGGWQVHDARSANGTRVDGEAVAPGGASPPVRSGTVVVFGSVACEIISSGELYDSL